MLPSSEWLKDAQKLPVGQTRRIYHGSEKRPNLVIKNLDTGYSAYCHACHDGGYYPKELVKIQTVLPTNRKAKDAGFLRSINLHQPDTNIPYSDIALFLHSKHMTLHYISNLNPKWSAQDKRIVFQTTDQVVGRDITGLSKSKWYQYSERVSYIRAKPVPLANQIVILTEDLFSACKAQYFAGEGIVCVALMGTSLKDDLLSELLTVRAVIVCLDGDAAGKAGMLSILRTLRLVGCVVELLVVPQDLDPKDMLPDWWREQIEVIRVRSLPTTCADAPGQIPCTNRFSAKGND